MATDDLLAAARAAAAAFELGDAILEVRTHGRGLINDTFVVTLAGGGRSILQRLNARVFTQPAPLMANLRAVLDHARGRRGASALHFPVLHAIRAGGDCLVDAGGQWWRAMSFIEGGRTLDSLSGPVQARAVGTALAQFHALLQDIGREHLHDARPHFHDTPHYLARLDAVRSAADNGRARAGSEPVRLSACLAFVEARRAGADVIESAKRHGLLSLRTIHGDPKLDNFLFDTAGERVLSLIDLDTVTTGPLHYDIGDCLRSCCNRAGESPDAGRRARFDVTLCRGVLEGYLATAGAGLTAADIDHLYHAIRLIPLELGIRFLTDFLAGDRYFRVEFPGHNLLRAATQFELVQDIEDKEESIRGVITELAGG